MTRRSIAEFLKRDAFANEPKPWDNLKMLPPKLRGEKKLFTEQLRIMTESAQEKRALAEEKLEESIKLEQAGKMLLPRMQLSEYVVNNYLVKISAARHKETLMERMDIDAIRRALSGGDAKVSELTDVAMELIRSSLASSRPNTSSALTLQDMIRREMEHTKVSKEKDREENVAMTMASTNPTALALLSPIKTSRKRHSIDPLRRISTTSSSLAFQNIVGEARRELRQGMAHSVKNKGRSLIGSKSTNDLNR